MVWALENESPCKCVFRKYSNSFFFGNCNVSFVLWLIIMFGHNACMGYKQTKAHWLSHPCLFLQGQNFSATGYLSAKVDTEERFM